MTYLKILLLCLAGAGMCFAQTPQTGTAPGLAGTITIDGKLDEACYSPANLVVDLDPARTDVAPAYLGTVNDAADLSAKGYVFWDAQYLYIGVHRVDDIHQANAQGTGRSWADDDMEYFVTPDYEDANADYSVPMYGTKGFHFILSLDEVNKEPILVFDELTPDGVTKTKTELSGAGFLYEYTNVGGANYDTEVRIAWASSYLGNIVPAEGTTIGFSVGTSDNDGSGYEGSLVWCGPMPHKVPGGWGKIILGPAGSGHVIPYGKENVRLVFGHNDLGGNAAAYDILGRKITGNAYARTGIRFMSGKKQSAAKTMLLK